jgi:hypothetical protein
VSFLFFVKILLVDIERKMIFSQGESNWKELAMAIGNISKQRVPRSPWKILVGVVVGGIIAILGFLVGRSSHQVVYQPVGQGTIVHYIVGDDTDYFQMDGSPTLYTVHKTDFSPIFSVNVLGNGTISLVYQTENTSDIDVISTKGTHLKGSAYKVIEISVFDNGQQQAYATSDYSQHPNGYYVDNGLLRNIILGFGLVIAILAIIVPNRIMTMLAYTGAGAGILIVLALVYVGISIPLNLESIKAALFDDLILFGGAAVIGAAIGLIVGIVQAVRGHEFDLL